ncbi:DNA-binding helix-turn-helix protein [Bifidobacterium dentium ATCC 27679]|uniref:DNA-binding helix-turn-helix protein n=2 Tax=Bifidobacterium dentium TaxID=1689 RepID=E0Q7D3_9BIFI|nr:DNA-binding helix-turn-helix protein [Bifidobacterium dentium ATCC 27679]
MIESKLTTTKEQAMSLKSMIEKRHTTQTQLAQKSGIPQPTISEYVTGKRPVSNMTVGTALKLMEALNTKKIHDLM